MTFNHGWTRMLVGRVAPRAPGRLLPLNGARGATRPTSTFKSVSICVHPWLI